MKHTRIPLRSQPSGHELFISKYFFKGTEPLAKKAYLQTSIHGSEVQGNTVIFYLLEYFKKNPPLGDITLVPFANPVGMDRKTGEWTEGRFDATTGENWNRAYFHFSPEQNLKGKTISEIKKSMKALIDTRLKLNLRFAERLALTLQSMAVSADVVLDLHNANCSVPHAYVPESALKDALYLGIPYLIKIPPVFGGALDEAISVPWNHLQKKLNLKPESVPQGYTLELGNQELLSFAEGRRQANGILQFLKHQGTIEGKKSLPKPAWVAESQDYVTLYAEAGGVYDYVHPLGKMIKKGGLLAERLSFHKKGALKSAVLAPHDFLPLLHYSSALVSQGDELFKGFSRWKKVSIK